MIGEKTNYVDTAERANAPRIAEVAYVEYLSEIFLASEVIKQRKQAQLEMARLTRQAVKALECLTQRMSSSPVQTGKPGASCQKQAGNQ